MKVLIDAYLYGNLGDDLFVDILTKRYPYVQFITISNFFQSELCNIKVYNSPLLKLSFFLNQFKKYLIKNTDMTISIGGSMYIEEKDRMKNIAQIISPYFVVGSNFGPYYSDEFYKIHEKLFSEMNDVCFRESYSYELFKHIDTVRKAPDIVFGMDTKNMKVINSKKVIISVILCQGALSKYQNTYEKKIIEIIKYFISMDYEVCLMSFCQIQGDETAIESICSKMNQKVNSYYYRGNREEALNILSDSSIIIGTRFHANVLGLLLEKTIIPISYSKKTDHMLDDVQFTGKVINLKEINDFDIESLDLESQKFKLDIQKLSDEAQEQFSAIDRMIEQND